MICKHCGRQINGTGGDCPLCHHNPSVYEPTTDEIREACERIQATWSATEERHRRNAGDDRVELLVLRTSCRRNRRWREVLE